MRYFIAFFFTFNAFAHDIGSTADICLDAKVAGVDLGITILKSGSIVLNSYRLREETLGKEFVKLLSEELKLGEEYKSILLGITALRALSESGLKKEDRLHFKLLEKRSKFLGKQLKDSNKKKFQVCKKLHDLAVDEINFLKKRAKEET